MRQMFSLAKIEGIGVNGAHHLKDFGIGATSAFEVGGETAKPGYVVVDVAEGAVARTG
jgi:hypothetical protein